MLVLLVFDWPISKSNRQLHLNSNLAVKAVLWHQRHANPVGCASLLEHSIIVDHKASGKYTSAGAIFWWRNFHELMLPFHDLSMRMSSRGLFICLHPSTRCQWGTQSFHLKRGMWCFILNNNHLEQKLFCGVKQDDLFDPNILWMQFWLVSISKMQLFMKHLLSQTLSKVVFIIIHIASW